MSEHKWGSGERSLSSNPSVFNDLLLNWCSTTTSTNMSHQAWAIADLPHRHWKLKYLPDEFRSEDIKDENHPYHSLLQTFDQIRDLQFTTDDIPALACLEPKLQQIGKIIDKLIDLPGPHAKGIFDFTALSAYVHTINDLWSKRNQMYLTPIWRQPLEYRHPYQHYTESLVYDPILLSQLSQISLILDWWLGKPQFDFWIGIIDLNFDNFTTQLEAYVHCLVNLINELLHDNVPPRDLEGNSIG
ncbi:12438_t:CDS:2, partial [Acaulospora colombiana]